MRLLPALLLPIALAACGGSGPGNSSAPAAPVAGLKPPAGQQWSDVVALTPEGGYRVGNPQAPIKLVEYGSRTCPTCGAFGREGMRPLEEKYVATGKVSYEFRDYAVHGAPDLAAGLLGRCGGPGPFFPILEQMYVNQRTYLEPLEATPPAFQTQLQGQPPERVTVAWAERLGLIDFVKQRGIPEARARACLTDVKAIEALAKITDDATASGTVTGTPTFLINGSAVENTVSWAQLEPALKAAGA